MSPKSSRDAFGFFYTYLVLHYMRLGAYFVLVAWSTLNINNELSEVGHIFLIGTLADIFLSPFFGAFIDRSNRKKLLILGQMILALSTCAPFILTTSEPGIRITSLYAISFLAAIGLILVRGTSEGIFQALIPDPDARRRKRATYGVVQQASLVLGTALMGGVLNILETKTIFFMLSLFSLAAAGVVCLFPRVSNPKYIKGVRDYWIDVGMGISYLFKSPVVLICVLSIVYVFSASQVTNIWLPSLIKNQVGAGGNLYSLATTCWGIGGVICASILSYLLRFRALKYTHFVFLIMLGALSILLVFLTQEPMGILFLHLIMGACFSGTRVLCDGYLLKICPENMIGRLYSTLYMTTSFVGMLIYILPSASRISLPVQYYYTIWGTIAILVGVTLWAWLQAINKRHEIS